ncbi:MAG TPA: hypothetical protein PKA41_04000 [Verrucomicrobiota bacterium]|nr:hypothetical protein [Verrucomicrobiota bacterium]
MTIIVVAVVAQAQPINDYFTNRTALAGLTNIISASTIGATREPGEPIHGTHASGASIWWSWTAPTNGVLRVGPFTRSGGGGFPAYADNRAVYVGNVVSNLTKVWPGNTDRDAGPFGFLAAVGTTYQIVVETAVANAGPVELELLQTPQPLNDDFADGISVPGTTNSASGSNAGATKETGEPNHAGSASFNTVWWTWTAPTNWPVTMDTFGSLFDTVLAVYTGNNVSNLLLVAENDDAGTASGSSRLIFSPTKGIQYHIAVATGGGRRGVTEPGSILLNIRQSPNPPPPPNDLFANRIILEGANVSIVSSNSYATVEVGEPDHHGKAGGASLWWSWTATNNGNVFVDTGGSSFTSLLGIYAGNSVSSLTNVASTIGPAPVSFSAIAETEYQIAVAGYLTATGTVRLNLLQDLPYRNLTITGVNPGNVAMTAEGLPLEAWAIERSAAVAGPWAGLGAIIIPAQGSTAFVDNSPLPGSSFYRLSSVVPASVRGVVRLTNTPPAEIPLNPLLGDPMCSPLWDGAIPTTRFYSVGPSNGLADVLVYITNNVPGNYPVPATPLTLDCIRCLYEPYISAVRTGQVIRVTNLDPFFVNVHAVPAVFGNAEQNLALLSGVFADFTFPKQEFFLTFRDDTRPWRFAYVSIIPHPFFCVTDANGNFALPAGLPPGNYTLEAYHRRAGRKTVNFLFDGVSEPVINFELGAP